MGHLEKKREKERTMEKRRGEFRCLHCREFVSIGGQIGTEHRNHCPLCLWSKHVDLEKSGDRKAECGAPMEPLGLTFKQEGLDKWGKPKQGELMLIHCCYGDGRISINRIAADDNPQTILNIFGGSKKLDPEKRNVLEGQSIKLLDEGDEKQILIQLFGK